LDANRVGISEVAMTIAEMQQEANEEQQHSMDMLAVALVAVVVAAVACLAVGIWWVTR